MLSVGGNNLLTEHEYNKRAVNIPLIFEEYMKLVKAIKMRMKESKMLLCDIYYPKCSKSMLSII